MASCSTVVRIDVSRLMMCALADESIDSFNDAEAAMGGLDRTYYRDWRTCSSMESALKGFGDGQCAVCDQLDLAHHPEEVAAVVVAAAAAVDSVDAPWWRRRMCTSSARLGGVWCDRSWWLCNPK
jgi:hypothetical protein